jgi:tyrosine phenol-lyase
MAGGQPFSMDNAKELYAYCRKEGIPVMFDATRAVENAYMIKKRDPRYKDHSIKGILQEMFSYGDGCTVSSKKDCLVNIGGFLAYREDEDLYRRSLSMVRKYEGPVTSGGLSAGDLASQTQGIREMVSGDYIRSRVEQVQYLGKRLLDAGIPIVEPPGTHAIFLDAKRFLPHLDQDAYPAQALAAALFLESGIRAMERGVVSKGRNPETGLNYHPSLELVRLTIPRRVYTNAHMDVVAEAVIDLYKKRDRIKGLRFTYEPLKLRFFLGRFEEIDR